MNSLKFSEVLKKIIEKAFEHFLNKKYFLLGW